MRVVFLVALLASSAQGWGRDGHAIIADIASGLVKDTTRTQVLKLLGADGNMSGTSELLRHGDGEHRGGKRRGLALAYPIANTHFA